LISLKAARSRQREPASNLQENAMTHLLKALPLFAALVAAPALAQTAADATAQPQPKAPVAGCPGAPGQPMGAHMANGHMANSQAMTDYMTKNQMMGGQGATPGTMMGGQGAGAMMGGATGGPNVRCPNAAAQTPAPPKK
jgi:hypothetical protein